MTNHNATPGIETINQGDGPDTLTITAQNQLDFGDTFDGGTGTDTIILGAVGAGVTLDLSVVGNVLGIGFHNYEGLLFQNISGVSSAAFVANQFGTGFISSSLAVRGVNTTIQVITVNDAHNFSAAKWTFTNWERSDILVINGDGGGTSLTGSRGSDAIHGNQGADIITGGLGQDDLIGGADNDTFRFLSIKDSPKDDPIHHDLIVDFAHVEGDRIDLHAIDANTQAKGNQAFHFIKAQKFHHKAGELHFVKHALSPGPGTFVMVEGDVNGDGRADFHIDVRNVTSDLASLVKGDFIL